jgi:hypothetical protein
VRLATIRVGGTSSAAAIERTGQAANRVAREIAP